MMEDTEDYEILQSNYLSPNIKLLGDILGEVLIEQSGVELFNREERFRTLAKKFREENNLESWQILKKEIKSLPYEDKATIINAFSTFFKLANLAEEYYKITVTKIKESKKTNSHNFTYVINRLHEENMSADEFKNLLNKLKIQLVWTAHPTEARRLTIMMKLREVYDLLDRLQSFNSQKHEYHRIRARIKEHVALIWQSDELREDKVMLLDEVRTVLWYFNNSVFEVVPDLYYHLWQHLSEAKILEEPLINLPKFIEFGSWVGGDRDGHPGVTADVTIQTLLLHKRLCLRKYRTAVEELIQHLSSSTNLVQISDELEESIANDELLFPEFAQRTSRLNQLERYRRKLDLIRLKLENSLKLVEQDAIDTGMGQTLVGYTEDSLDHEVTNYYKRSNEFYEDLMVIYHSLSQHNGQIIADGLLSQLIVKVQIFGFHLAPLDLRQHSGVHFDTLCDIFEKIGLEDLNSLTKEEQSEVFIRELKNPRPLGVTGIQKLLSSQANEVIKTLFVAADSILRVSPRSISTYIISMSTHERDILGLMLLMKEVGLIKITNGKATKAYMDIAPLFETQDDLIDAPKVMDRLYNLEIYKSYLELRNKTQEIMIGYSDSTKDVGIVGSNYRLVTAQQKLVAITNKYGYQIRVFHGRGGSVSRGGGPTHRALLSMPPNTVFDVKITEQGEVVGQSYSNREIALTHLEGITSAMLVRGIEDSKHKPEDNPRYLTDANNVTFEELAQLASQEYEAMVKHNPDFIPFYLQYTPLDLIERATIGSRPSRRTKSNVSNISSLRAIPWIFSWSQTRLIFPSYFGLGKALQHIKTHHGLDKLHNLYKDYPYFESMILNIQMQMLKVDLEIAELYLDLLDDENGSRKIFNKIKEEYELSKQLILELSNTSDLLGITPDIANSIRRRNPYLDPLSIIQVSLLKEWREKGKLEDMDDPRSTQRLLLQTVNGIAAGLKNTG